MTIKVVIADDHEVVRSGLESIFDDSEIAIIGQASTGEEAIEVTLQRKPDILITDIRMAEVDGLQVVSKVRAELPEVKVVVLSMYDNPTYVARAIALGVNDYILKSASPAEIVDAITEVALGHEPKPESILNQIKSSMAARQNTRNDIPLTNREAQVLRHIALGLSNKEIGVSLNISIETVKEHVQNILRKIDASDRTQAAIWAMRQGLLK